MGGNGHEGTGLKGRECKNGVSTMRIADGKQTTLEKKKAKFGEKTMNIG